MASPETRNWSAVSKEDNSAGSNPHVEINGEVRVSGTNKSPRLAKKTPQGIVPNILLLELTIETIADSGNAVMNWKPVKFEEPRLPGQHFKAVSVLYQNDEVASINVQDRHS